MIRLLLVIVFVYLVYKVFFDRSKTHYFQNTEKRDSQEISKRDIEKTIHSSEIEDADYKEID